MMFQIPQKEISTTSSSESFALCQNRNYFSFNLNLSHVTQQPAVSKLEEKTESESTKSNVVQLGPFLWSS